MDNLKTIFARNCRVERIGKQSADAFTAANHRLGSTGGRYRYALVLKRSTGAAEDSSLPAGTIVAVAVFSNARRWRRPEGTHSSYEWIRYCSLSGYRVTGGMSRLLHHFIEEVQPDDVMSYADPSGPDGGAAYATLGFHAEAVVLRAGRRLVKYRLDTKAHD